MAMNLYLFYRLLYLVIFSDEAMKRECSAFKTCIPRTECEMRYAGHSEHGETQPELKTCAPDMVCCLPMESKTPTEPFAEGNTILNETQRLPTPPLVQQPSSQPFGSPNLKKHKNYKLLPRPGANSSCGKLFIDMKMNNGYNTTPGEFPWMALLLEQHNGTMKTTCGGTLINKRYVLTAAHCVLTSDRKIKMVNVRLFEHTVNVTGLECLRGDCLGPAEDFSTEEIRIHKDWSRGSLKNDIALLRLQKEVEPNILHKPLMPICLPLEEKGLMGKSIAQQKIKEKLTVAGWGNTGDEDTGPSHVLSKGDKWSIKTFDECNLCKGEQSKLNPACPLSPTQICAVADMQQNVCYGDSGGPLMLENIGKQAMHQVGIVSWSNSDCRDQNVPNVFTNVQSYIPWILDHLEP